MQRRHFLELSLSLTATGAVASVVRAQEVAGVTLMVRSRPVDRPIS